MVARHRSGAHPHSRPILCVSQMMTTHIEGLTPEESEQQLDELFDVLYSPENIIEHDWHAGDLVVWDNLATQHARGKVTEQGPERSLRKVIAPRPDAAFQASVERPTFDRHAAAGSSKLATQIPGVQPKW
jgi:taurine dioxygenase